MYKVQRWVVQGMMDDPVTVEQFCRRYVEPMGEESDHIHIVAITDALQVRLCTGVSEQVNNCQRECFSLCVESQIRLMPSSASFLPQR